MPKNPKLIIFASGSADGGGSGFEKLVLASRDEKNTLNANIVAVVSNHEHGGVRQRADKLGIPFIYFQAPYTAEEYQRIITSTSAEFIALSGWLKMARGLDPRITFNIHPGPLPQFGGKGMHGHHVHESIIDAYKQGQVTHSAVTMHFVTEEYDKGPTFFHFPVEILASDTPDTLGKRVNAEEHKWQPLITNKILHGKIGWDGENPTSLFGAEIY